MNPKNQKDAAVFEEEPDGIHRGLQSRHLTMIAIAGTIGTGLFLKSGDVIANAGALGALSAYVLAGISVFCVVMSLGEMATMIPLSGSFNEYAGRFIDPALGFAFGWMYWFQWLLTFPVEIQAAAGFVGHWSDFIKQNPWYMFVVLTLLLTFINLVAVTGFGEAEYWMSFIKIITIVVFIFVAIGILITNRKYGFQTYTAGGSKPFENGGWGILGAMVSASFAFGGTELVGITAGEAANPSKSVPRAINGTFWRIAIFYFSTIFLIGLILSSSQLAELAATGGLDKSPFVFTLKTAGIGFASDLINFVALVAVVSAANSSVYACSRTMMALCQTGKGPAFLGKNDKRGVPLLQTVIVATLGFAVFFITLIPSSEADIKANHDPFDLLVGCVGACILMAWTMISFTHIRFRAALKAQGIPLTELIYVSPVGVIGDYISIIINVLAIFFSGTASFFSGASTFNAVDFLDAYLIILAYPFLYIVYKIAFRTKFVPLTEIDFVTGVQMKKDVVEVDEPPKTFFGKLVDLIA
ncbi:hypothetical protein HDV01_004041 [Terramyces sp. JEL0728]|nr:hypothetical protein HDV01_004041 [Terramyces sp. JEL0728]